MESFLNTKNRINIDYKISPIADYTTEFVKRTQGASIFNYDALYNSYSCSEAKTTNNNFMMSPYTICNGGGQFISQILFYNNGDANTELNGCAVVLLRRFIPDGSNLLLKDIYTGIGFG